MYNNSSNTFDVTKIQLVIGQLIFTVYGRKPSRPFTIER